MVNTTLGDNVSLARAVFFEMFLTSTLVLSVLMLAAEKHKGTYFAPIGIGLTLFAGHLWGGPYTGPSMNTARSFGPSVISGFESNHWVYWVGPFMGSILATVFYVILKRIKYWKLNPDQDVEDRQLSPEPLRKVELKVKADVALLVTADDRESCSTPRTEREKDQRGNSASPV